MLSKTFEGPTKLVNYTASHQRLTFVLSEQAADRFSDVGITSEFLIHKPE